MSIFGIGLHNNLINKFIENCKNDSFFSIDYFNNKSNVSILNIIESNKDFAVIDYPPFIVNYLTQKKFIQFPFMAYGIVPVINIPTITKQNLNLTGDILAKIYLGKITKWNDPQITSINSNINLPDTIIHPIYRLDNCGITAVFTNYLSIKNKEFCERIGTNTSVKWPIGLSAKNNEDAIDILKKNTNSIAYVDSSNIKKYNLSYVNLKNNYGFFVSPNFKTFNSALSYQFDSTTSKTLKTSKTSLDKINYYKNNSWPIMSFSYILLNKNPKNMTVEKNNNLKNFFNFIFDKSDKNILDSNYIPLPENIKTVIKNKFN